MMHSENVPTSNFVVGRLPMTEDSIPPGTLGHEVAVRFQSFPNLSGLLIVEGDRLCGMVSRYEFNQRLAKKFGVEVSYWRPILGLFEGIFDIAQTPLLMVEEAATVNEVVERCLQRSDNLVYEPIIVHRPKRKYGLINFHDLLLAQTRLLAETFREARRQKEIADQANRAKSHFLANVSHELRTPLTAILGYTEILLEDMASQDPFSEPIQRLNNIHKAGDHLLSIIGSLLDIAKIESGRMELFVETFDLRALLDQVVETITPLAASNDNKIEVTSQGPPGEMTTDITKLRQNLFNLLSNACKFTRNGVIGIEVDRVQKKEREMICFRISDTGIGMSQEQISRIFEPFTQADASTTRKYGGTGLGLAVTRSYCELMGGEITVESSIGAGTTFTMYVAAVLPSPEDA
jgi:signal transduction histidine kinase